MFLGWCFHGWNGQFHNWNVLNRTILGLGPSLQNVLVFWGLRHATACHSKHLTRMSSHLHIKRDNSDNTRHLLWLIIKLSAYLHIRKKHSGTITPITNSVSLLFVLVGIRFSSGQNDRGSLWRRWLIRCCEPNSLIWELSARITGTDNFTANTKTTHESTCMYS